MSEEIKEIQQVEENAEVKIYSEDEYNSLKSQLEKERKNSLPKEDLKAFRDWQENQKTAEQKHADEIKTVQEAKNLAEQRANDFEAKYTAMSKGVKSEAVEDVIALAKCKVSETVTLSQAIDSVIAKYPQFAGTSISTGIHTNNNNSNSMSGVEAAFYAKNPDLK